MEPGPPPLGPETLFPKITERVKRLVHCTAFGHLPLTPVALGLSAQGQGSEPLCIPGPVGRSAHTPTRAGWPWWAQLVLKSFRHLQISWLFFKAPFFHLHKLIFKNGCLIYEAHSLSLGNSLNNIPAFRWIHQHPVNVKNYTKDITVNNIKILSIPTSSGYL